MWQTLQNIFSDAQRMYPRRSYVSLPAVTPNRLNFRNGVEPYGMMNARSVAALDSHCLIDVNEKLSSVLEKMDWLADRITLLEHAVQDTHLETKANFKVLQAQLDEAKRCRQLMSVEEAVTCKSPLPDYLAEELALLSDRSGSVRSTRSAATSAALSRAASS